MNASGRFLAVASLLMLAALSVWYARRGPVSTAPVAVAPRREPVADPRTRPSSLEKSTARAAAASPSTVSTRELPGDSGEPPIAPPLVLQKGELPWEARIRQIVSNTALNEADKSRLLLEALPSLPVEGRETAAEEAVKRLPDRDYRVAQTLVLNPSTPGSAMAILWTDLMERPDEWTLPTLLQVARNSAHPYAPYARENLQLLLGRDFGADWNAWDAAVRERVRSK